MAVRYLPKNPSALPEDGWLVNHPRVPAIGCSWCECAWLITPRGAIICPICDIPRRSGELRPVDLDADNE